jgi:hypothetical protein
MQLDHSMSHLLYKRTKVIARYANNELIAPKARWGAAFARSHCSMNREFLDFVENLLDAFDKAETLVGSCGTAQKLTSLLDRDSSVC